MEYTELMRNGYRTNHVSHTSTVGMLRKSTVRDGGDGIRAARKRTTNHVGGRCSVRNMTQAERIMYGVAL